MTSRFNTVLHHNEEINRFMVKVRLNCQTMDEFKEILATHFNRRFDELTVADIRSICYQLVNIAASIPINADQDIVDLLSYDDVDIITINQEEKYPELVDQNRVNQAVINNNNNNINNANVGHNAYNVTARILGKAAMEFAFVFSGRGNTMSLSLFQNEVLNHQRNFELNDEIIFKLLFGGKVIIDPARSTINEHYQSIYDSGADTEIPYKSRVKSVWKVLSNNYASIDLVYALREKLRNFRQYKLDSLSFVNSFKAILANLKREIAFRNELNGSNIHREPSVHELGQIIRSNINPLVLKFVISEGLRKYQTAELALDKTVEMILNYSKHEQATLSILSTHNFAPRGKGSGYTVAAIDTLPAQINNNQDKICYNAVKHEISEQSENQSVNQNKPKLCHHGILENCKQQQNECKYRHFNTEEEWIKFKIKAKETKCKYDQECKFRECFYNHPNGRYIDGWYIDETLNSDPNGGYIDDKQQYEQNHHKINIIQHQNGKDEEQDIITTNQYGLSDAEFKRIIATRTSYI